MNDREPRVFGGHNSAMGIITPREPSPEELIAQLRDDVTKLQSAVEHLQTEVYQLRNPLGVDDE